MNFSSNSIFLLYKSKKRRGFFRSFPPVKLIFKITFFDSEWFPTLAATYLCMERSDFDNGKFSAGKYAV
jgi:hypothetical protein